MLIQNLYGVLRGQNGIGYDSLFKFTQVPSKHFIGLSFGQPFFSGHIELSKKIIYFTKKR